MGRQVKGLRLEQAAMAVLTALIVWALVVLVLVMTA
jgi:hypothetical protein